MKCYKTRDLSLAAFLFSINDLSLFGTEKEDREVHFLFTPEDKAEEFARLYWADRAPAIQPRQLFQSLRSLKDLLFSGS